MADGVVSKYSVPAGKDAVIVLGVNIIGEAVLASTKTHENIITAWCAVDNGILLNVDSVKNYQFVFISKTDTVGCYVCDEICAGNIQNMLCVDLNYNEANEFAVYFSGYAPFFIISAPYPGGKSLQYYNINKNNIVHFNNYNEAKSCFENLNSQLVPNQ